MVIRVTFKSGDIGPSLKGRLYSYTSVYGEVTASWPKKRSGKPTEMQLRAQDRFREACIMMKIMHPDFIAYAAKDTKGKPMLPRDALMAALFGRGPNIYNSRGEVIRPMATRIDFSQLLDNLAWKPGSILYRTDDTWVGLDPPNDLKALIWAVGQGPEWADPVELGVGKGWWLPSNGSSEVSSFNTKGTQFLPFKDINIDALTIRHALSIGQFGGVTIYAVTPTWGITEIVADYPNILNGGTGEQVVHYDLPATITFLAGQNYVIAARRPTAAGNSNTLLRRTQNPTLNLPIEPFYRMVYMNSAAPMVGNTFTVNATGWVHDIGMRFW